MARNFGPDGKTFYIAPRYGILAETFKSMPRGYPPMQIESYTTKDQVERFVVNYRNGIEGYVAGVEFIPSKDKYAPKVCLILIDPAESEIYRIESDFASGYGRRAMQVLDNIDYSKPLLVNAYDIKEGKKRNVGLYFDQDGERVPARFSDEIFATIPKFVEKQTIKGTEWDKTDSLNWYYNFLKSRMAHFFPNGTLTLRAIQERTGIEPKVTEAAHDTTPGASTGVPPQKSVEPSAETDQGVPDFMTKEAAPAPASTQVPAHNPAIPPQPNHSTPVPPPVNVPPVATPVPPPVGTPPPPVAPPPAAKTDEDNIPF